MITIAVDDIRVEVDPTEFGVEMDQELALAIANETGRSALRRAREDPRWDLDRRPRLRSGLATGRAGGGARRSGLGLEGDQQGSGKELEVRIDGTLQLPDYAGRFCELPAPPGAGQGQAYRGFESRSLRQYQLSKRNPAVKAALR
jgi:hypothetical protein